MKIYENILRCRHLDTVVLTIVCVQCTKHTLFKLGIATGYKPSIHPQWIMTKQKQIIGITNMCSVHVQKQRTVQHYFLCQGDYFFCNGLGVCLFLQNSSKSSEWILMNDDTCIFKEKFLYFRDKSTTFWEDPDSMVYPGPFFQDSLQLI